MSVLIILVNISVIVAGGFLAAFIWSVNKGQYDDDYTPSVRMLFDDTEPGSPVISQVEKQVKDGYAGQVLPASFSPFDSAKEKEIAK
jgi:cbb3-type cytochrome oxidase maturation protein